MCASVCDPKAATCNCIFTRVACGDVGSKLLSGTLLFAVRREGPVG